MPMTQELDSRLKQDTYLMGMLGDNALLLNKNALYPWFILVPATDEIELYKLKKILQLTIIEQVNQISVFIEQNFNSTKINTAAIGNVVSQLHIHIIGRHPKDACWPGVVWGNDKFTAYEDEQVRQIQHNLFEQFGKVFTKT